MKNEPFNLDEIDETIDHNDLSDKIDKLAESLIPFAKAIDSLKGFLRSNYEIAKDLRDYQRQMVETEGRKLKEDSLNSANIISDAINKTTNDAIARIRSEADAASERLRKAENRYSFPPFGFHVLLTGLLWLFGFLCVIIYANATAFHLKEITYLVLIFLGMFILSIFLLYLFCRHDR